MLDALSVYGSEIIKTILKELLMGRRKKRLWGAKYRPLIYLLKKTV